jgi:hypothetical protein
MAPDGMLAGCGILPIPMPDFHANSFLPMIYGGRTPWSIIDATWRPMENLCTKCNLPFECMASDRCWCQSVAAWQAVNRHPGMGMRMELQDRRCSRLCSEAASGVSACCCRDNAWSVFRLPLYCKSLGCGDLGWGHLFCKSVTNFCCSLLSMCCGAVVPHMGLD